MPAVFDFIKDRDDLVQSDCFGELYELILDDKVTTFANPLVKDIEELYTQILGTYEALSPFQEKILSEIIEQFNQIRTKIDPHRLKDFRHGINDDKELILYRSSPSGLTNLIIHGEEEFAYSFIGYHQGDELKFFTLDADFEKIVYDFFSN